MKKVLALVALLIISAVLVLSISVLFKDNPTKNDSSEITSLISSEDSSGFSEYPSFDSSADFSPVNSETTTSYENSDTTSTNISSDESSSTESVDSNSNYSSVEDVSSSPSSTTTSSEVTSSKEVTSSEVVSLPESSDHSSIDVSSDIPTIKPMNDEMRAIWISYIDMASIVKNRTESQFKTNFEKVCKNSVEFGLNTLIVHVRPFSDAYYNSSIFPWSSTITGTQGQNPGYDPLEIMVDLAHKYDLKIEAWINPYRVATSSVNISSKNPAYTWLNTDKVKEVDGKYFYNPASEEVMQLIVDGVVEIVENYNVDGIHFDDYFYPTTDKGFDKNYYEEYKTSGGKLSLEDYRRNNVTALLKKVYRAVKQINPNITFGISPNGNNNTNYNSLFLDIEDVVSSGCVDYICPQIYFGFNHGSLPYKSTVDNWSAFVKNSPVKIYIGLAAYKVGASDQWAGTGKSEWLQSDDILKRQVQYLRDTGKCDGFMIYSYSSLFAPESSVAAHARKEKDNLGSIMN